jgi:hypothetical protein
VGTSVRLQIDRRESFAEGHAFGDVGAYERLVGTAHFALDPADAVNANVVDLGLVPVNGDGLVEFSADLDILKPVDLARGNGTLFYDVNNRGNMTAMRAFNDAPASNDPTTLESAGNGYLLRQGYTVVWSGWQGDMVPGMGLLACELPEALENGQRLRGLVRQEFIAEREGVLSMPLSGAPSVRNYEALDLDTSHATMTLRHHEQDERVPLAPSAWSFARAAKSDDGQVTTTPSAGDCAIKGGFNPGWIYELIYETEGSRVMGLGIVGIRDLVAFLRADASASNPLAGGVRRAYFYGQSLSARVVRQFIYDGYNGDAANTKVFEAVYTHVSGGGRLFANARFAQVGRYPRQHEEHQWPSERYPFAYSAEPDAFSDELDAVLKRPESDPLVMHTHTNTEYWNRTASLGHTSPKTGEDIAIPESVRMYFLASAQHMGANPAPEHVGQQPQNQMSNGPLMRAALAVMDSWVVDGTKPAASIVPRRADGTLVSPEQAIAALPNIPGVTRPAEPNRLPLYDHGPDFDRGLVTEHPPKPVPGKEYTVQLPLVDADGNDTGGLRSPEIMAPVGTHTGWNVRKPELGGNDLGSLLGSFIAFPRTKGDREATGDPRVSIEERYGTHAGYVDAVRAAAETLAGQGFLLAEDVGRYVAAAQARNPLDASVALAPLMLPKG